MLIRSFVVVMVDLQLRRKPGKYLLRKMFCVLFYFKCQGMFEVVAVLPDRNAFIQIY